MSAHRGTAVDCSYISYTTHTELNVSAISLNGLLMSPHLQTQLLTPKFQSGPRVCADYIYRGGTALSTNTNTYTATSYLYSPVNTFRTERMCILL